MIDHPQGTDGDLPARVCPHGQLRRQCETCDLLAHAKTLEAELEEAMKKEKP